MTSIVILFTVFTPFGHSCISSLVSGDLVPGFSINSITPIFVADYISLSGEWYGVLHESFHIFQLSDVLHYGTADF